ncbi:E3 ubiquitin-protein ligase DZIP3 [Stylophora pistillata]|uniref:E3 ubiquitin-protein ligase DZIP3 n=1 Tax=Stylophora pistillata TaxID=50429 RepID=A0A2B4RTZ9_STYPI|nr:E3 ubiquitin-protein ligase DZIP3 [Stylophora pistillata]
MATAAPTTSSTKETTNYARLCRMLVDIGTQALRDTFDAIHAPASLHTVLAANKSKLQSLKTKRIINPTQWGQLFPAIATSVSSRSFDTTLLMVLLRNLCGLTAPLTGWDTLPDVTDLSREADIARVKYFRNTVYGHAEKASVDDTEFNDYWRDIRDTLVRLGGVTYEAAIDDLRNECMDPEAEGHYMELLSQWEKDEGNIKEELGEMKKLQEKVVQVQEEILQTQGKMLHALIASKEIVDQGDLKVKHEIKLNIDTQKRTFKRQFAQAQIFLKHNTRSPTEGLAGFLNHLENDFRLNIKELKFDCFEIGVTCSKPNFESLLRDDRNGKLNKLAERFLLTNEVKKKLNLEGIGMRTVVKEEESVTSSRRVAKSGVIKAVLRLEIITQNHGTCNRQFAPDINIFKKRDSFSPSNGLGDFLKRVARDYFLETPVFGFGCLEIRIECPSLEILEKLWKNYRSGRLDKIGKRYLLTDEVKNEAQLKTVNITTMIKDDEYNSCRKSFSEVVEQLGGSVGPGTK